MNNTAIGLKAIESPHDFIHDLCKKYEWVNACYIVMVASSNYRQTKKERKSFYKKFVDQLKSKIKANQELVLFPPGVFVLIEPCNEEKFNLSDFYKTIVMHSTVIVTKLSDRKAGCSVKVARFSKSMPVEQIKELISKQTTLVIEKTNNNTVKKWNISEEDKKIILESANKAAEVTGQPSFVDKVGHYAKALLAWHKAGYPTRTDVEVAAIVDICNSCEKFNKKNNTCSICGCKVSLKGWSTKNKAKMGTEHCPMKKW